MKKIHLLFCLFISSLLFICSCQMSIDGNLISVENVVYNHYNVNDTLDAYDFPIPRIKKLYFHTDDYNREYIDIIYNNGYAKTYSITKKEAKSDNIYYELDNEKVLSIIKRDKDNVVFWSKKWTEFQNTDFSKYHSDQHYTISSISYSKESPMFNTHSFNEILSYISRGEVVGSVKSVSHTTYVRKHLFGEDSLLFMKCYNMQYDKNGNLLNIKYKNEYYDKTLYSAEYDRDGNIILENRGTVNVKYENNKNELKQIVSFYDKNKKVAYRNITYNLNDELSECDYYKTYGSDSKIHLDRKVKYKKYHDCIYGYVYDGDGKELYRNKYDINYSLLDGCIDLGDYSEYFNPFCRYGTSDTKRDCSMTYNKYNTNIKVEYPYSIPKYEDVVLSEKLTYNEHCNIVKREVEVFDNWQRLKSCDKYIFIYKYDLNGNWIERHAILTSHLIDGKETVVDSRGFIEYRKIEYFN